MRVCVCVVVCKYILLRVALVVRSCTAAQSRGAPRQPLSDRQHTGMASALAQTWSLTARIAWRTKNAGTNDELMALLRRVFSRLTNSADHASGFLTYSSATLHAHVSVRAYSRKPRHACQALAHTAACLCKNTHRKSFRTAYAHAHVRTSSTSLGSEQPEQLEPSPGAGVARGEPSPGTRLDRGEPSPGADV